jgi:pyruvate,water dikinase
VEGTPQSSLRPDDELKRLAVRAVELGVDAQVRSARDERELSAGLAGTAVGERWLADYLTAKEPWFCFSYGNGMYHHHRSWIDDPKLPIAMIGSYIARVQAGEDIRRPQDAVLAERDRVTGEYRALLPDQARDAFDRQLALARTVFPHIEDHNFYIDHWSHTVLWNKVREFGALLSHHAFLADSEDVFFLRNDELRSALDELRLHWSSGGAGAPRGPSYWPPIVERRKTIYQALRHWTPPPALGLAPHAVTEPVTIMLWGITTDRVQEWLRASDKLTDTMPGIAGSPGVAEGLARVILAPFTSTSWTPVFGRIAGVVTDIGGIMCHAAIIAREYGLPAVLGTGSATKRIATGDRIRVDADNGIVTILT